MVRVSEQIDQEIADFLDSIDKQLFETKKKKLMEFMDKFLDLYSKELTFEVKDFDMIRSNAIQLYKDLSFPKDFKNSYKSITPDQAPNFCLILSTINYLESQDCLKRMPKFNLKQKEEKV